MPVGQGTGSAPDRHLDIAGLRNLGPRSVLMLREGGFGTVGALRAAGPAAAFQRLRFVHGRKVSLNLLWALAAGLEGRDWRSLSADEKMALRAALPQVEPRRRPAR